MRNSLMIAMFRTLLCTLLVFVIWICAVMSFSFYVSRYKLDNAVKADGIVVLTGGGGRIDYGLELLARGRAKALFISGVNEHVAIADILGAVSMDRITLGREAENTIGNAAEGAEWIKKNGYKSVLLVTADYHMPRALTEFSTELSKDVTLIAAPVKTQDYRDLAWVRDPATRNLILAEFHKLIAAKIRHMLLKQSQKS